MSKRPFGMLPGDDAPVSSDLGERLRQQGEGLGAPRIKVIHRMGQTTGDADGNLESTVLLIDEAALANMDVQSDAVHYVEAPAFRSLEGILLSVRFDGAVIGYRPGLSGNTGDPLLVLPPEASEALAQAILSKRGSGGTR